MWTLLAACAAAFVMAYPTLHAGPLSYDEGVYWQSLRAMADGHLLFSSVFSSQPPLFLLSVYPFYMLLGQSIAAARLALVFFSVAGIIGTYVAGRALGHRTIGAVACILLALDPLYHRAGYTLQAEIPSLAFQIWAVACAALSMRASQPRRGWLVLSAGLLLGCASLMKLFAISALVPVAILVCVPAFQHFHDNTLRTRPRRRLIWQSLQKAMPALWLLAAGLAGAAIVTLLPFIGRLDEVYDQVVRFHLIGGQLDRRPVDAELWQIAKRLGTAPLVYISALSLLFLARRPMWASVPLIFWALAALVVLLQVQPLFNHHVVLLSPALALISGCGAAVALQESRSSAAKRLLWAAALAVMIAVSGDFSIDQSASRSPSAKRLEMAEALNAATAPGDLVLSDDQFVAALADRDVPPQMVDTSNKRIKTGFLTTAQLKDATTNNRIPAILFATGRFDKLTGFRAWVEDHYALAATFGQDKSLFVLNR